MLDPAHDLYPPPTSPTISSPSSSDLDTESTGSFFPDRSTSLGTLMGVSSFPPIIFSTPSQPTPIIHPLKSKSNKTATRALLKRRRTWWGRLCSDQELKPSKLGEFLEVERRFGDGAIFSVDGVVGDYGGESNGRVLFADGRVLPPMNGGGDECSPAANCGGGLCRFSVSLPGICS
ncbi:Signal recognition particle family protein [Heracleum sosnowskyi]|uniref:Signal recognition particle family protein n=1 Tax=Heracleum sosnowskyi TaxID=360622 RepID=A0AAD8JMN2_9APIA|nr:Signal recognition particle family protein [Heracleum sosnowskyi]